MQEPFHRRPAAYAIGFLLLLLFVLTLFMAQMLNSPALEEAREQARMHPNGSRSAR